MSIESIAPISLSATTETASSQAVKISGGSFGDFLSNQISQVNDKIIDADVKVRELGLGKTENLHEVMISLEEAKVSLELMVQVRNRLVEAYQEVLRMRI